MEKQEKILLLYTSHTFGHKSIAENIGFQLEKDGYHIKLADILEIQKGRLTEWVGNLHRVVTRFAPWIWSFLYTNKWFTDVSLQYRLKVAAQNYKSTLEVIQEYQPEVIITTQTTASAVVAFLKQKGLYKGKFGIAFSDFHLHRYWLYWQADFYLANTEEQKQDMRELGISEEIIFVCGIMLKDKRFVDTTSVRKKFSIDENEKIVLVSSGSFGFGLDEDLLGQLNAYGKCKVIVVTGRNKTAERQLKEKFANTNVIVCGFYDPMEELYAVANVFISKPGGLSVSEALRYFVPLLVVYMLPGQEELNYNYLTEKGLLMPEPIAIMDEVAEELETGNFKKSLELNPNVKQIVGKPEVLLQAVKSVLQHDNNVLQS